MHFAWYHDGKVSAGSSDNLANKRAPYRFTLASGYSLNDLVDIDRAIIQCTLLFITIQWGDYRILNDNFIIVGIEDLFITDVEMEYEDYLVGSSSDILVRKFFVTTPVQP